MLDKLRTSDRGVSPVIGVILMVAITVILAAVVATFVLDMGSSLEQNTPTVQGQISDSSATYGIDTTGDAFDIAHEGGAEIQTAKMKVVVRDSSGSPVMTFEDGSWSGVGSIDTWKLKINSNDVDGSGTFGVGDTLIVHKSADTAGSELKDDTEYQIQVVHTESNSMVLKSDVILS